MEVIGPRALVEGVGSYARGFRVGRIQGDVMQLGGEFVIAPGGALRFAHVDPNSSGQAPLSDVLAALD
jgi:hypothetical protein